MRLGAVPLLLLATSLTPAAPARRVHFERVGSESGPLPEVVTALAQDRAGFVWIGSRHGLYLYDGYELREFKNDPSDPSSISDHAIRTIFEDRKGRLWIGTNAGGLERLDRARWTFEHFRHSGDPTSLSHDSVYEIAEGRDGALWVATQQGLNRFDPESRRFERVPIAGDYVVAVLVDREGRIWSGTNDGGVTRIDPGGSKTFRHDASNPRSISADAAFEIVEDAQGTVWLGTADGLDRWDAATGGFVRTPVRGDNVVAIVPQASGRLWVGTFGGGLQEFDPKDGQIRVQLSDPLRRDALGSDRITALLGGRDGTLWVGSWGGGLQRLAPAALELASAEERSRLPGGLRSTHVGALCAARDGSVWMGTINGELVRRAPHGEDRTVLQGGSQILAITEDRARRMWIGTHQSLSCFSASGEKLQVFAHDASDPLSLGPGYVRAILEDGEGRIWAGTGEGGVQRIDPDGKIRVRFRHEADAPDSLSDDYVTCMRLDREGTLWVGTRSGGLNALDPATGRARRFLPVPGDPTSIGHRTVSSILEDRGGRLWVGTAGGGVQLVERAPTGAVRFRRFTQSEGLVDDDVVAIVEDDDGSLWLSTRKGLARLDPSSGAVANYGIAEGVPAGELEIGSAARTADTLYFGGVRGLVAVPAGMPMRPAPPSPTVLTALRTGEGAIHGERPAWDLDRLEVPYGTWLALELAVLDFGAPERNVYAYRLGPEEKPWVDLGTRRSVTFADLAPGRHRFSAKGRNGQGVWSATRELEIVVPPPFWMTAWFRFGGLALVVAGAVGAHRVRTASLARRNRQLVDLQVERERAQKELRTAYDRLRGLTRRFEAAKEEERKRIARELHDDLGPSLTAVIINLQLLADPSRAAGGAKRLAESTELVDRIIQQIRDLSLALRPPLLDEMGLVPALRGYLESTAERTGLDLSFRGDPALSGLAPEVEITAFRVAQEALTNVVRHARAKRVTAAVERKDGRLVVAMEDDGVGFDVAAILGGSATGRALGLLGMTERVQLLGGDLAIESSPGSGTRVRAELPLEAAP